MTTSPPPGQMYSTRAKIVMVVVLAVAIGGFTLAVLRTDESGGDNIAITGSDQAQIGGAGTSAVVVEDFFPGRGVESLSQQPMGIDLASGWAATEFTLNGVAIPDDQVSFSPALSTYEFLPAEGLAVSAYEPGTNCASALVYQLSVGTDTGTRTERWCFEVL